MEDQRPRQPDTQVNAIITRKHSSASVSAVLVSWAEGYCHARGYSAPVPALNGQSRWFSVDKPGQRGRYILVDQGIETLAEIHDSDVYVEMAAPRASLLPMIPVGWLVRTPAFLMTASGRWWEPVSAPPATFAVQQRAIGNAIELVVEAETGELAARGVVGLVGPSVVFDQIVTEPSFRRQGLGGFVMRALAQAACNAGATEHLLIATEEGRELYQRLGWEVVSDAVSLVSPTGQTRQAK